MHIYAFEFYTKKGVVKPTLCHHALQIVAIGTKKKTSINGSIIVIRHNSFVLKHNPLGRVRY